MDFQFSGVPHTAEENWWHIWNFVEIRNQIHVLYMQTNIDLHIWPHLTWPGPYLRQAVLDDVIDQMTITINI